MNHEILVLILPGYIAIAQVFVERVLHTQLNSILLEAPSGEYTLLHMALNDETSE